jgi:hypothetical protein
MGARLKLQGPARRQSEKIRIDVSRDRRGEFFEIRCQDGCMPEVLHVEPASRHMVLMLRDGRMKNKYLLGHDERHWFAAAVPGRDVRDVCTAKDSLRPAEARCGGVVRQGEWFFVPAPEVVSGAVIHRNEPLSRGAGSKPHRCEELMRTGGRTVWVSASYPTGIGEDEYHRLIAARPHLGKLPWRTMTRDAVVFARGAVRHPDHETIFLDGWHSVYLNRERLAPHAAQIAFLD